MIEDKVRSLYESWPYPEPVDDLVNYVKTSKQLGDVSTDRGFYSAFPRRNRFAPKILIAGCGSYQAAVYAFNNPDSQVVGIDLSSESLGLTEKLQKKHSLKNLTLHQWSILDLSQLNEQFDYIVSTGVLHHLENPGAGLVALKGCLRDEGVMHLMLYGATFRVGIYWLQWVFQQLDIHPKSTADVDKVLAFIRALPEKHPVRAYVLAAKKDLGYPGAVMDTFFHPQDQSYSLDEIHHLLSNNRLNFQGFENNGMYYHGHFLRDSLSRNYLKEFETCTFYTRASIVEKLSFALGTHRFYVTHDAKPFGADLVFKNSLDFVPALVGLKQADSNEGAGRKWANGNFPWFYPTEIYSGCVPHQCEALSR